MKTMSCMSGKKRYLWSKNYGKILNFLPLPNNNGTTGLILKMTGGARCWNRAMNNYAISETIIEMICDLEAGIGYPEIRVRPSSSGSLIFTFLIYTPRNLFRWLNFSGP